ncbi:MAG: hypothetical protein ACE5OZ_22410, partial [Candidatus Heimdallarchaeota archaeon]
IIHSLVKFKPTLGKKGVLWKHIYYNNDELKKLFLKEGSGKVRVLRDRRNVRYVWVENPDGGRPLYVEPSTGWAAALTKEYGDEPIDESTWRKDIRVIRKYHKEAITAYSYLKVKSRLRREKIIGDADKRTKTARRAEDKKKESKLKTERKSSMLSQKPMKKSPKESPKKKKKKKKPKPEVEIDWDTIQPAPSKPMGKAWKKQR